MTSVIPVPFYYKKSMKISIVVSVILAGAIATYAAISTREEKDPVIVPWAPKNDLGVDVSEPDVLIDSSSLSKLPADILSVPLLKDTLTEDFVFYYQNNADKLGLTGSLQRIVYEHHLTLKDSLINELLNQPAKIALWRDHKGKLNHFIMVIHRSGLAKMLEPLAHVVADDSQLSKASPETIQVGNRGIALYKLRYNGQKSLLFASDGDKMVLLSGERFLFKDNKQVADTTALLNDLFHDKQPWNEAFSLTPAAGSKTKKAFQQQILVRSSYLAMGYPASSVNTRSDQSIDAQIKGAIYGLPKGNQKSGVLVVNGISMPLRIEDDGSFQRPYIFPGGSNSVEVRSPDRQASHRVQFYARPGQGSVPAKLRIVLSWDSDNTDLDLHVVTPNGEHAWYGNRALQNGGALDMDVTTGYGPEIFSTPMPEKGPYLVYVNYFGGYGQQVLTTAQVSLVTNEGTPDEKQETFVIPMRNPGELTLIKRFVY